MRMLARRNGVVSPALQRRPNILGCSIGTTTIYILTVVRGSADPTVKEFQE
jgi:hypothetical protein